MSKHRTIRFFSIRRQERNTEDTTPAHVIKPMLNYLKSLDRDDRFYDINSEKCCFAEVVTLTNNMHKVIIKSAKSGTRLPLVDRQTRKERKNPKKMSEGEGEITHMIIKYATDDVYLILEANGLGVGKNSIMRYFKHFTKEYIHSKNQKVKFRLQISTLAKSNFLQEIQKLKRVVVGNVYVEKKILGSDALNFSNRTQEVRHDVILKVVAEERSSILSTLEDIYNKFTSDSSIISKIRVEGKTQSSGNVVVDTSFIEKLEHISADTNALTGAINTTDMFTQLIDIANTL